MPFTNSVLMNTILSLIPIYFSYINNSIKKWNLIHTFFLSHILPLEFRFWTTIQAIGWALRPRVTTEPRARMNTWVRPSMNAGPTPWPTIFRSTILVEKVNTCIFNQFFFLSICQCFYIFILFWVINHIILKNHQHFFKINV